MNASAVTGAPRAERAAQMSAEPAIEVADLSFSYGDRRALCEVEFTIARGEIFGFLGPNGGGKSTLFRLLSTLVPIQSGNARILGCDLRGATQALRRRIGVVFQSPSLDGKLTVAENLTIHGNLYGMRGARPARARASDAGAAGRRAIARATSPRRSRAGCAGESSWPRRCCTSRNCCCSTSRAPGSTPRRGASSSTCSRVFAKATASLSCSPRITWKRPSAATVSAILDQGRLVAIAPPGELKQRVGGDVMVISAPAPEALAQKIAERLPDQRGAGRRHAADRTAARTRTGGAAGRRIRRRDRIGNFRPAHAGGRFRAPDGPSLRRPRARGTERRPLMGRIALAGVDAVVARDRALSPPAQRDYRLVRPAADFLGADRMGLSGLVQAERDARRESTTCSTSIPA